MLSGLSGLIVWLLSRPNLRSVVAIRFRLSRRTPREVHRALGLVAACLLVLEAFTGLWLCFPENMRGVLTTIAPVPEDVRPVRPPRQAGSPAMAGQKTFVKPVAPVSFAALMAAAHDAMPDGFVREIRMPEGNSPVQIRMWRPGDFRSLGNNVVYVSRSRGQIVALDRYSDRSTSNRFVQSMAGLHYDEWGGMCFRLLSALAGILTPVLFMTGILIWWFSRRRNAAPITRRAAVPDAEVAMSR